MNDEKENDLDVKVEEERKCAELKVCPHCEIKTPHWQISNGKSMCGFCGTEH